MAAGRRRGQKKAAGSRGPAPFTVVAFSAADYGSAEDAVEAARQVAAAAQAAAPGGQLFLALDCGGAEDWAPAFAPFVDIGAGGVALRALAAAPAVEPRHATRDQSLCVFGVVDEGGGVDEGRLLLRRGLFFQTGGSACSSTGRPCGGRPLAAGPTVRGCSWPRRPKPWTCCRRSSSGPGPA